MKELTKSVERRGEMKARNFLAVVAILASFTAPIVSQEGNINGYKADKRMPSPILLSAHNPLTDGPLSEETIRYEADKRIPNSLPESSVNPLSHPLTTPFFIENAGQFAEEARFQVKGSRRTIWLSDDAIWFVMWGEGETRRGGAEEQGSRRAEEISPLHPSTLAPLLRSGRGEAPLRSLIEEEES
jgi:hypothetical protein